MKNKLIITILLICIISSLLLTSVCFAQSANIQPIKSMGDLIFYILAGILVIAVIVICIIFRYSKKFVIKERERILEEKKEYIPSKEIRITDKTSKKE